MPPPVFLQSLIQTYRKHKPGAPSSVKSEVEAVASVGQAGWDRGDSLPEGVPLPPLVPASRHHKPWEGLYTSRSSSHLEGVQAYPPANTKRFQSQNGIRHNIRDTGAPANDDPSCPSSQESRNLVPVFLDDYSAREQAEFRAPQPFPVAQTIHEPSPFRKKFNSSSRVTSVFSQMSVRPRRAASQLGLRKNQSAIWSNVVTTCNSPLLKRNPQRQPPELHAGDGQQFENEDVPEPPPIDFCEDCSSGYQEDNARSSISSFSQSNKEDNESVRIDQGAPTVIIDDFHSRRHHAPPPPPSKQLMSPAVSARATRRSSSLRLFKEFLQMKFGGHTSDKRDATPSTNEDDMNRSHARLESHERREDGDVPNSSRKKQKRNRNNLNQQFGEVGLRTWTDTGTQTEVAESNTQSDNRKITICGSDLIQVKRRVVKHLTLDQQSRNMSSINPDFKIERITVEVVENEKPNAKHRADEKRDPFELKRRYSTKSSLTDTNKRRAVVERSKVAKEFRDEGHFDQTKGFGGTSRKKANVKIKQRGDTSISSIIGTDSSASKYWGDRTPMLEDTDDVEEEEDYLTPGGSGNPEDDSKGKKARLQPQAQDQRNAQQSRTKSVEYQRLQQPDEHQHISKKSVAPNLIDFFSGSEQRHSAGTSTAPSNIQCSHPHAPRRDLFLSPTNLERPGPNSEKRDDDECFLLTLTRGEQENEYFNWISEKRRGMPRRYVDSFCCEARKSCQMACHNYYEVVPEPTEQDTTGGLRVLYPRKTPEMQLRSVRSQTDDSRMQEDNFSIQPMGPLRCTVVPDAMEKAEVSPIVQDQNKNATDLRASQKSPWRFNSIYYSEGKNVVKGQVPRNTQEASVSVFPQELLQPVKQTKGEKIAIPKETWEVKKKCFNLVCCETSTDQEQQSKVGKTTMDLRPSAHDSQKTMPKVPLLGPMEDAAKESQEVASSKKGTAAFLENRTPLPVPKDEERRYSSKTPVVKKSTDVDDVVRRKRELNEASEREAAQKVAKKLHEFEKAKAIGDVKSKTGEKGKWIEPDLTKDEIGVSEIPKNVKTSVEEPPRRKTPPKTSQSKSPQRKLSVKNEPEEIETKLRSRRSVKSKESQKPCTHFVLQLQQLPAATLKWVETQLKKSGLTLESQGDERFYYFLLKLRSDSLGERMPSLINQEMNRKLYKIRVDSDTNVPGLGIRLETKDSIFQFLACEGYLKATFMVGGNCDDANKLLHLDNSVLDGLRWFYGNQIAFSFTFLRHIRLLFILPLMLGLSTFLLLSLFDWWLLPILLHIALGATIIILFRTWQSEEQLRASQWQRISGGENESDRDKDASSKFSTSLQVCTTSGPTLFAWSRVIPSFLSTIALASFFLALIWFLIPMEKCLLQGGPTQYFLSWFREIGPNNWQDNLNCAVHSIKHCAFDPKAGVCSITQLLGIFLPSLLRFVFIHFVGLPLGLALSLTLTNLEKHTTEYSWSYSRVAKLCLFVGIINFGIPVYFAFILKPEDHVAVAAFTYSFLTLLILLDGVRILLSYLHEPSQAKAAVSLQSKVSQEGRKEHWDEDRFMLDIWIRTGHALLFFLSAPLAPFIALLGFLVKDSWDRRKLLLHSLQPIAQQGLGLAKSWMIAFYVLGFFCLLSNSHIAWSQISRVASEWGTFQLLLIVIVVTTLLMAAYGFSILVT